MDERRNLIECLEILQKLIQPDNGARVIKELASVSEAYQTLHLINALTEGQTVDAIVGSLDDEQVRRTLQSVKSVFHNISGILLVLSGATETVLRALQPPAPFDVEQVRIELLALSRLRQKVVKDNDTLGRLFAPLLEEGAEKRSTWNDLDRAEKALLEKAPGMFLAWQSEFRLYGLFPIVDYQPGSKTNVSE